MIVILAQIYAVEATAPSTMECEWQDKKNIVLCVGGLYDTFISFDGCVLVVILIVRYAGQLCTGTYVRK